MRKIIEQLYSLNKRFNEYDIDDDYLVELFYKFKSEFLFNLSEFPEVGIKFKKEVRKYYSCYGSFDIPIRFRDIDKALEYTGKISEISTEPVDLIIETKETIYIEYRILDYRFHIPLLTKDYNNNDKTVRYCIQPMINTFIIDQDLEDIVFEEIDKGLLSEESEEVYNDLLSKFRQLLLNKEWELLDERLKTTRKKYLEELKKYRRNKNVSCS